MRLILLFIISLLITINISAQNEALYNKIWKVESISISSEEDFYAFQDELTYTFHVDSLNNPIDYQEVRLQFSEDGTFDCILSEELNYTGTWSTSNENIILNDQEAHLFQLDENNIIIRRFTDDNITIDGDLDTMYHFQHFTKVVTTSQDQSIDVSKAIDVFPNPAQKEITIDFKDLNLAVLKDLRMYNAYGQLVLYEDLQEQNNVIELNISTFPVGLYFIEVNNKSNNKMGVKKISISR